MYYERWEYSYIIIPIRATKIEYQPLTYYIKVSTKTWTTLSNSVEAEKRKREKIPNKSCKEKRIKLVM